MMAAMTVLVWAIFRFVLPLVLFFWLGTLVDRKVNHKGMA